MTAILVLYTLLNIMVFGLVVLFARATRARSTPNERVDLEDNSIIAEEWELVRRKQCLPSHCPRLVGSVARPRKDVTCEICAALFMERYWQEHLSGVPSGEGGSGSRAARDAGAPMGYPEQGLISLDARIPDDLLLRRGGRRPTPRRVVLGRRIYVAGFCCVVAGAAIGVLTPLLLPGYLLVATGIGLLIVGAASGPI